MSVLVVAVLNFLASHEVFVLVNLLFVQVSLGLHLLDLFDAFFLVGGDLQVLLVAPQDIWLGLDPGL